MLYVDMYLHITLRVTEKNAEHNLFLLYKILSQKNDEKFTSYNIFSSKVSFSRCFLAITWSQIYGFVYHEKTDKGY